MVRRWLRRWLGIVCMEERYIDGMRNRVAENERLRARIEALERLMNGMEMWRESLPADDPFAIPAHLDRRDG